MPKSPHPGHQSLWTSVAKSEGFRICSRATGQHRPSLRFPAEDRLDGVVQLRVRHRAAVVLHDEVSHLDARMLPDDSGELRPEIHLDPDSPFRFREVREYLRRRERIDQPNMEVADFHALRPEPPKTGGPGDHFRGVAVREPPTDHIPPRHLAPDREVEGQQAVSDALLQVPRGEYDPRAPAVARMEREPQVALLVASRHSGA